MRLQQCPGATRRGEALPDVPQPIVPPLQPFECPYCLATFATNKARQTHITRRHRDVPTFAAQDTNCCLVCQRVCSSVAVVRRQIARSVEKGTCDGTRGSAHQLVAAPMPLECPICKMQCSDQTAARVHRIGCHLPQARDCPVVGLDLDIFDHAA